MSTWAKRLSIGAAGLISMTVAFSALTVVFSSPAEADEGSVQRVVDGDTVDVRAGGETVRVRLLNIDTPETVDPRRPVECLGEEATRFTNSLVPEGTHVRLKYDEERTDRYGRTLAHLVLDDGRVVSDEVARQGLGVPMSIGANDERIGAVRRAFDQAALDGRGFFDPSEDCTVPAQATQARQEAGTVSALQAGATVASAEAALRTATDASRYLDSARAMIVAQGAAAPLAVRAYVMGRGSRVLAGMATSIATVDRTVVRLTTTVQKRKARAIARAKAKAAQARAEARAAARARATEKARAAAEARRLRQVRAEQEAAALAAESRRTTSRRQTATGGSSGGASDLSGYTGPRCYAPGGKSWKPC